MNPWRVLKCDIFRWKKREWPDFVYKAETDGKKLRCFYAIWKADYLPEKLHEIHRKIGEEVRKMFPDDRQRLRLIRVESYVAGYKVAPGRIILCDHESGERVQGSATLPLPLRKLSRGPIHPKRHRKTA